MIYAFCVHERKWVLLSAYQSEKENHAAVYIHAANHAGKMIVTSGWSEAALMTLILVEDMAEMPDGLAETFRVLIANADLKRSPRPWLN